MTMPLYDRSRAQLGRREVGCVTGKELVEQKRIGRERLCPRIVGEERWQLVAKSQDAARLQPDDRNPDGDEWIERVHHFAQPQRRALEHALIVKRAAAA